MQMIHQIQNILDLSVHKNRRVIFIITRRKLQRISTVVSSRSTDAGRILQPAPRNPPAVVSDDPVVLCKKFRRILVKTGIHDHTVNQDQSLPTAPDFIIQGYIFLIQNHFYPPVLQIPAVYSRPGCEL